MTIERENNDLRACAKITSQIRKEGKRSKV